MSNVMDARIHLSEIVQVTMIYMPIKAINELGF